MTEMTTGQQRPVESASRIGTGSREHLARLLLLTSLLVAAILRLTALGAQPLAPSEAEHALRAWGLWHDVPAIGPFGFASPAYVNGTAILLAFLGASDAVIRLAPALLGLLLVGLPWLWRDRLGNIGVVVTSVLLATSPTMAIIAVTANGTALALVALCGLLIAWSRFARSGERSWAILGAGAVGLGAASGPLFYSGFATMVVARFVQARFGPSDTEEVSSDGQHRTGALGRAALIAGATTFLAAATLFLWRPAGLGDAAAGFGAWLAQFGLPGQLSATVSPLLALGRYELVVVILGGAATFWATWRGAALPVFLFYWFSGGLLLLLFQPGVMENVLLLVLPAYFLIGLFAEEVFRTEAGPQRWLLTLLLVVAAAVALVNGARYLRVSAYAPDQIGLLLLAMLALVMGATAVVYAFLWNRAVAVQGTFLALLTIFVFYSWGTSQWMVQDARNDPRERWVAEGTDDDVLSLSRVLHDIGWQRQGAPRDLEVIVATPDPVLAWYLRDFRNAEYGATVPPGTRATVIITPASDGPPPGEGYFGADFGLRHTGARFPDGTPQTRLGDVFRWWLFHDTNQSVTTEQVILWVQNEPIP